MSKCRYCECELPGNEQSCLPCYESRYAAIGKPKPPIKDLVLGFIANPLGLKVEDLETRRSFGADIICTTIGLLLCWLGGYAKLHYQVPAVSKPVLHAAEFCLVLAVPLALFFVRIGWKIYWRGFCFAFLFFSYGIYGWFAIGA